jgi:hypothetical protein
MGWFGLDLKHCWCRLYRGRGLGQVFGKVAKILGQKNRADDECGSQDKREVVDESGTKTQEQRLTHEDRGGDTAQASLVFACHLLPPQRSPVAYQTSRVAKPQFNLLHRLCQ